MPMKEISKSVEDIEIEAKKILEEAKANANEILFKAREEAKEILSAQMPMDEVETECQEIVRKANIEASKKDKGAARKASEIRANADRKIDETVKYIVDIIIGRG